MYWFQNTSLPLKYKFDWFQESKVKFESEGFCELYHVEHKTNFYLWEWNILYNHDIKLNANLAVHHQLILLGWVNERMMKLLQDIFNNLWWETTNALDIME